MKINDIISSGLLELYATGLASESEAVQVLEWANLYPEVAAELAAIEAAMAQYGQGHQITPPTLVKTQIFNQINTGQQSAPVINIATRWKYIAAIAIVLLGTSISFNAILYQQKNNTANELVAAQNQLTNIALAQRDMEEDMEVVKNKYSHPIALKGMDAMPDATAKIFWMKNTGEVYIDASNLPAASNGMAYQLWAFVDGKPQNAGYILTTQKGQYYRIQKMKAFGKVEAFAVTLEKELPTPLPAPEGTMVVMGKM